MNRRSFITTSAVLSAGTLLSGCKVNEPEYQSELLHNWAGNINYSTQNIYYPMSVEEVQQIIKNNARLKCLG